MTTLTKPSLFWDVSAPDPDRDADFIIGRVLAYGDVEDFKWIGSRYGEHKVEDVLTRTRQLDQKSLQFWCGYFHINPSTCTQRQSMQQPGAFLAR